MFKVLFSVATVVTITLLTASFISSAQPDHALYHASDWVKDGTFTTGIEGPAVNSKGQLYAVNYGENGTIGQVLGKDKVTLFSRLPAGSIGNGIRFDGQDTMYIADYIGHNILSIKTKGLRTKGLKTKRKGEIAVQVYAHHPKMHQPNDLAIMDNGILFASDPNWSKGTGQLWQIDQQGKVKLLEQNMGATNGIEVSPDNKKLYVNESVQRHVWVYDLDKNGAISNKKRLITFADHGLDGMRTDNQGNLMIARYGKGVIAMVSPQGELLREIKLKGQFPTNVAFGGKMGNTVFVTLQKRGAIERFESEFAGRGLN